MARLKLSFSPVDIGEVFPAGGTRRSRSWRSSRASRLDIAGALRPMMVSTDAALAHQIMVSLLSHVVQQAGHARLARGVRGDSAGVTLTLTYVERAGHRREGEFRYGDQAGGAPALAFICDDSAAPEIEIVLRMTSQNATIFIIDDNEGWVELLGRFLEGYNYLVVSASGGQDIVDQAQELNPALIILDVMMPERDGWELLQRLRVRPATAQIPILVCTVFNDAQLAYSLGATGFISKPANREQILEALEQIAII